MGFMESLQVTSLLLYIVAACAIVPTSTSTTGPINHVADDFVDGSKHHHPAAVTKPRLIERYDKRYPDGRYEYRYTLSDGDTRYERSYWMDGPSSSGERVLARIGFYSYPLTTDEFLTVFYTSDANGYRVDSAGYSRLPPSLPQTLDVPPAL